MTRFARAKGSKSSNEKKPEEASSWSELKNAMLSKPSEVPERIHVREKVDVGTSNQTEWASLGDDVTGESLLNPEHLKARNKNMKVNEEKVCKTNMKKKIKNGILSCSNTQILTEDLNSNLYADNEVRKVKDKDVKNKMFDSKGSLSRNLDSTSSGSDEINKKNKKRKKSCVDVSIVMGLPAKKKNKKEMSAAYEGRIIQNVQNEGILDDEKKKTRKPNKNKKCKELKGKEEEEMSEKEIVDISEKRERREPFNQRFSQQFKVRRRFKNDKKNFKNENFKGNSFVVDELVVNGEKVQIVKFQGFNVTLKDAERLKKLMSEMIKEGIPREKLEAAIKLERRRAEKALARLKKAVCFNCRGSGHVLSNCPNLTEKPDTGTGICYKCGSTEHSAITCKVVKGTNYQFAECFICNEQGHIARQCPDNPRGLYPQGGACRICGDVTHLKKDCPEMQSKKSEEVVTVGFRNDRDLECLDEEIVNRQKQTNQKHLKKNSAVTF